MPAKTRLNTIDSVTPSVSLLQFASSTEFYALVRIDSFSLADFHRNFAKNANNAPARADALP